MILLITIYTILDTAFYSIQDELLQWTRSAQKLIEL